MSESIQTGEAAVEMPSLPATELAGDLLGLLYGGIDVVEELAKTPNHAPRELSLVRTKLEEAAMWYGAFLGLNPDLQGEVQWKDDQGGS